MYVFFAMRGIRTDHPERHLLEKHLLALPVARVATAMYAGSYGKSPIAVIGQPMENLAKAQTITATCQRYPSSHEGQSLLRA